MVDFGDQRVLFLKSVSEVVDELRESGICKNLTQTVLLGCTLGYKFGLLDVVGVKRYDVRVGVLARTPGFVEYATAIILAVHSKAGENLSRQLLNLADNVDALTLITNSGLLHLAQQKHHTGLSLSVLLPELMIQSTRIREDLDLNEIDLPDTQFKKG